MDKGQREFDKKTRTGLLPAGYHMGGGTLTGENHLMDLANKDGERKRRIAGKIRIEQLKVWLKTVRDPADIKQQLFQMDKGQRELLEILSRE